MVRAKGFLGLVLALGVLACGSSAVQGGGSGGSTAGSGSTVSSSAQSSGSTAAAGGSAGGAGGQGGDEPVCPDAPPLPDVVSFHQHVQPIFDASCATAGCHYHPGKTGALLHLGPSGKIPPGDILAQLVNVAALAEPDRARVDPGNPDQSFLIRKVESNFEGLACVAKKACGATMPLEKPELCPSDIAILRGWIEQGALNN